jgi:superfamily II DNA or RNA helicase
MELRPYQQEALDLVREAYRQGVRRTLVVMPTGTGKTVLFAEVARRVVERGGRALVLAHRTELLEQARAKLRALDVWAEIEKAQLRAGGADVVVASVDTLRGARLEAWDPGAFRQVIVDEAHHATAPKYMAPIERFCMQGGAHLLGVTATPDRLDGEALGQVFETCAYRYEIRAAIADGYLCPLVARRVELGGVDLASVHVRAGDLASNELAQIMAQEEALHGVAIPLLEQAGDRRCIVFGVDVTHAHALAEVLNRYQPGSALAVDGSAKDLERRQALRAFRAGDFRILVNCALFTEGFDEPSIEVVAIARPTKSRALYAQMVGRGTRPSPGKSHCLILDFTGTAGRHSLVGPADVLAGGDQVLDEEVRAAAELLMRDEQLELEEVIDQAERIVAERRERTKATAVADYLAKEFDPFVGELPPMVGAQGQWVAEPASPAQRKKLEKLGLEKLPSTLTQGEAGQLIYGLERRREVGLCTFKQARFLARQGYETRTMSFVEASRLCAQLFRGFRSRSPQEGIDA